MISLAQVIDQLCIFDHLPLRDPFGQSRIIGEAKFVIPIAQSAGTPALV